MTFGTSHRKNINLDGMKHAIISMPSHMCCVRNIAIAQIYTFKKKGKKITRNPLKGFETRDWEYDKLI